MKKALIYMFSIVMLCMAVILPVEKAYAADISISASKSSVNIGDTVTVTVKVPENVSGTLDVIYPSDLLEFSKASAEVNSSKAGTVAVSIGKYGLVTSNKLTITFKAKTAGEATVKTKGIDFFDNNGETDAIVLGDASTKITIKNETASEDELSSDYYLAKLKVTAGSKTVSLSPTFNYRKTSYTATVDYDVTNVVVSATRSSGKAEITSMTGNGNVELKVGANVIEIVVKAENGKTLTYTVTVTRKEKPADTQDPNPSESEDPKPSEQPSEDPTEDPGTPDFDLGGVALYGVKDTPEDKIPIDFLEKTVILSSGKEISGLTFEKADITVLYLENDSKVGSLYVYNATENYIYPFVKVSAEENYAIILMPDDATVPQGYGACTLSIEGKGIVNAYQYQQEEGTGTSDFYLVYCVNGNGKTGWYQYDLAEGTYQRYAGIIPSDNTQNDTEDPKDTEKPDDTEMENPGNNELKDEYDELKEQLQTAEETQRLVICVAVFVVAVLLIIIVNLLLAKGRNGEEDEDEDDDDDEDEDDEPPVKKKRKDESKDSTSEKAEDVEFIDI